MPAGSLEVIWGLQRYVQLPGPEGWLLKCVCTRVPAKEGIGQTDGLTRNLEAQLHGQ